MAKNLHIQRDAAATARAFANFFLENAPEQDQYYVALSGGSTPKLLFQLFADEYADALPWERIHFFWGDERMVPPDSAESNYGVAKELFFDRISIPEANIHRIFGEDDGPTEAIRYGKEIQDLVPIVDELPRFDLVILGMGEDGHTASIFPHQRELLASTDITAVGTHPDSGQERVTLTGPVINNAAYVAFLVAGAGKAEKVAEIIQEEGDYLEYPAAHILPITGQLHWFIDQAAASDLSFT